MENLKIIVLIASLLLLFSCDKKCECEDNSQRIPELYQTFWEGTLLHKEAEQEYRYQIKISFGYKYRGEYSIVNSSPKPPYSANTILGYKLENRMLSISDGYNNILLGDWYILNYDKNTIILQNNIIDKKNSSKLILTKTF